MRFQKYGDGGSNCGNSTFSLELVYLFWREKSGGAVAISTTVQSLRRNSRKTRYLLDKPKLGPSATRFLANFTKFQEISALTMPLSSHVTLNIVTKFDPQGDIILSLAIHTVLKRV